MGTTFLIPYSSADHLSLVPFENKFINFVTYFNNSIIICILTRSIIGVRRTGRDHFNVQNGCKQNYEESHKYKKVQYFGHLL